MNPTVPFSSDFLDPCFDTMYSFAPVTPPNADSMDSNAFVDFFDSYPLPFPVRLSFNSQETDLCDTVGGLLRHYFSLGYRQGALDHFQNQCKVTQVGPDQFVFSGTDEQMPPSLASLINVFFSELTLIMENETDPDFWDQSIAAAAMRFYRAVKGLDYDG